MICKGNRPDAHLGTTKILWNKINEATNPVTDTIATRNCPNHRSSLDGPALLSENKEVIIPLPGANGSRTV
jgi:hypothetical protein